MEIGDRWMKHPQFILQSGKTHMNYNEMLGLQKKVSRNPLLFIRGYYYEHDQHFTVM